MKKYAIACGLLCFFSLSGCADSLETNPATEPDAAVENIESSPESNAFPVEFSTYSADELFAAGGGGCGMTLLSSGADFRTDGMLFFNGLESAKGSAFMKLNGGLRRLVRTAASGEVFYGQQTNQSFETESFETESDAMTPPPLPEITVDVAVTLGEPG